MPRRADNLSRTRIEKDSMGEMRVPARAYFGAQTERARRNFEGISGRRFPRSFIRALGLVKVAAADVNRELGLLDPALAAAIVQAGNEVAEGQHDREFVLDVFQTGSGTSTNMNANEVIASRANEVLGCRFAPPGERRVHPNDHVNLGQSSNDVIPTASHLAAATRIQQHLLPALDRLAATLGSKSKEFGGVIKLGRTHLQDATPVTLGQEFRGWATQVSRGRSRIEAGWGRLCEVALGGTAVGTGLNTHPEFAGRVVARLAASAGLPLREAEDHFEAQGARDALVEMSGALRTVAISLIKVTNDIQWLASGPWGGLGELRLPAVQPGSSIMPGKVNPVMAESLRMVCAQVLGNDLTVAVGGQSGVLELNTMIPVMVVNLLDSVELLGQGAEAFRKRCLEGIEADVERCRSLVEGSLALVTILAPVIGYEAAAEIAHEARRTGRTVREIAMDRQVLPADTLARLLDPWSMIQPGVPGQHPQPDTGEAP